MKVSNFTGTRLNFVGAFSGWATAEGGVAPVNQPPVADPQSVSVLEDGYIAITLTATDPEGAPLTYAVLSGPSNGVLTGTAPNLTYTPTPNYFGSDSFTFQADDGTNLSNIATVSITVVNVNDAPVADPQSVSVLEDGYIGITLTGSDIDGNPLTYSVTAGPSNGALTGTAPNLTYTPTPNYFGPDSFSFVVNDGYVNSTPATVTITVVNVNDAPVADPQSVSVPEDGYIGITLTGSDPEGNPLTYAVTSGPSNGVLTGTAPNLTYTPTAAYVGPDSFTFVVNDGYVDSAPATVSIDVQAVFPVATLAADFTVSSTIPSELTFSRASTGTYYDSAGILQYAAVNAPRFTHDPYTLEPLGLMLEEQCTNAALNSSGLTGWNPNQVTVTQNTLETAAPDGSFTAAKIVETTTAGGEHNILTNMSMASWVMGTRYSASIYAKAAGRDHIVIRGVGHATLPNRYLSVRYNLQTGVADPFIGTTGAGIIPDFGMERLQNGWWRCWISWQASTGFGYTTVPDSFRFCVSDGSAPTSYGLGIYPGNSAIGGVYLWGAQIEVTINPVPVRASSYVPNVGPGAASRAADSLKVASTAGWYNDPEWTMVHDMRLMADTGTANLDKWRNPPIANDAFFNITYAKELGIFTAVSNRFLDPAVWSADGNVWRLASVSGLSGIGFAGQAWSPELGMLVAVGDSGTGNRAMYSRDGRTWTATPAASNTVGWNDVAWSPQLGIFAAIGYGPGASRAMTSPDGINWTLHTTPGGTGQPAWRGIVWVPELSLFVAVGADNGGSGVMTSPDGINWTQRTTPNNQWFGITYSPATSPQGLRLVAFAYASGGVAGIMYSSDAINWTYVAPPATLDWISGDWSPELNRYVGAAAGAAGVGELKKMVSADGINWQLRGGNPIQVSANSDRDMVYRSTVWSPQHGVFAVISLAGNGRVTLSLPPDLERRLMRHRSTDTSDNWVTGTTYTGFLNSGIVIGTLARFSYYDTKLTDAELDALGV